MDGSWMDGMMDGMGLNSAFCLFRFLVITQVLSTQVDRRKLLMTLSAAKFSVMIQALRVTLRGAVTGRIQWHVIPEPRVTLQGAATW